MYVAIAICCFLTRLICKKHAAFKYIQNGIGTRVEQGQDFDWSVQSLPAQVVQVSKQFASPSGPSAAFGRQRNGE